MTKKKKVHSLMHTTFRQPQVCGSPTGIIVERNSNTKFFLFIMLHMDDVCYVTHY